ncbi:hypothetical protein [Lichenicola sp.]|uniref:hypothetical protein n=1 Tax=Lichenicola sp. TaxID=2804529 RepID=UPI003B00004D
MNRFACLGAALAISLPVAAWAAPPAGTGTDAAAPAITTPAAGAPANTGAGKSAHASRRGVAATPDISCPGDAVVWVNPRSKAYHMQGDSFFGRTKHGSFMCKKAADAAGDHPVKSK